VGRGSAHTEMLARAVSSALGQWVVLSPKSARRLPGARPGQVPVTARGSSRSPREGARGPLQMGEDRAPRRAQDGALLLTGSADGTARLWELEKGECIGVLSGHTAGVNAVAMDVAGRLAATCSADGTGRLWDLATCQCLHVLAGHGGSNLGARRSGPRRVTARWQLVPTLFC